MFCNKRRAGSSGDIRSRKGEVLTSNWVARENICRRGKTEDSQKATKGKKKRKRPKLPPPGPKKKKAYSNCLPEKESHRKKAAYARARAGGDRTKKKKGGFEI